MKLIEILEPCMIAGLHREAGEQVEVTDEDARILHHNPRVREIEAPAEPAAPVDEAPAETKAKK
jgi:hypothetical protein